MASRTRTHRLGAVLLTALATLSLSLVGAGSASAASGSAAERLLAAGAGQSFDRAAAGYQQTATCFDDPAGDVVGLESEEGVDDDRADIVEHCVTRGAETVRLTVEVAEPVDPETDENWRGSNLGWFVDVDGDGEGDYFVAYNLDAEAQLEAEVEQIAQNEGEENTPTCPAGDQAVASFEDGLYVAVVDVEVCLGGAEDLAVSPGLLYDTRVEDPDGQILFDSAPNGPDFEEPVPPAESEFNACVNRIAGETRIETAIAGSMALFDDGEAGAVVLTRADLFPDAQAGTPLAIQENAPMLLTGTEALDDATATEIQRVLPEGGTVYLLGGTAALSDAVETSVEELGYEAVRYGGANRAETAVIIANLGLGNPDVLLIADGGNFADAVIAGAASYAAAQVLDDTGDDTPDDTVAGILLTYGSEVPPETMEYIETRNDAAGDDPTYIAIGGGASAAFPDVESLSGETRFETAIAVAERFFETPELVGLATGLDFADALTGGAIIGRPDVTVEAEDIGPGPMLLTDPTDLPASVEQYLADNADTIDAAVIFGGEAAVSVEVEGEVEDALDCTTPDTA